MAVYEIFDEHGQFENRIVADAEFVEAHYPGRYQLVDEPTPLIEFPKVSRLQAKVALLNAGLLDQVEALMAKTTTDPILKMAWADAIEFSIDSPALNQIVKLLDWDQSTLEDLFIAASQISV